MRSGQGGGCLFFYVALFLLFLAVESKYGIKIIGSVIGLIALSVAMGVVISRIKRYRHKALQERKKRQHLEAILSYVGEPSINFFGSSETDALKGEIRVIEKFTDFVFLTDYKEPDINYPDYIEKTSSIFIITQGLKTQLNKYRTELRLDTLREQIKIAYLQGYTGLRLSSSYYPKMSQYDEDSPLPEDWEERRYKVIKRDNSRCVLCGDTPSELHVHHIQYRAHGGSHSIRNLVSLCKYCHATLPMHGNIGIILNKEDPSWDPKAQNIKIVSRILSSKRSMINRFLSSNPLATVVDKKWLTFKDDDLIIALSSW